LQAVNSATQAAWSTAVPEEALANATPYLQAFGHLVLAWLWLDVALAAVRHQAMAPGKHAAMRYFFAYELPKVDAWLSVVARREPLLSEVQETWF
jgi:butyryl-CoA dehydrogenase